jgi:3-isopropylmalate/(R)-2-methylmalate dehydratase small subunit
VVLAPADRPAFERQVLAVDGQSPFEIDLDARAIICPDGTKIIFEIDAGERTALLEGLDDVAMTLRYRPLIDAWENRIATHQPWLQRVTSPD